MVTKFTLFISWKNMQMKNIQVVKSAAILHD